MSILLITGHIPVALEVCIGGRQNVRMVLVTAKIS